MNISIILYSTVHEKLTHLINFVKVNKMSKNVKILKKKKLKQGKKIEKNDFDRNDFNFRFAICLT